MYCTVLEHYSDHSQVQRRAFRQPHLEARLESRAGRRGESGSGFVQRAGGARGRRRQPELTQRRQRLWGH